MSFLFDCECFFCGFHFVTICTIRKYDFFLWRRGGLLLFLRWSSYLRVIVYVPERGVMDKFGPEEGELPCHGATIGLAVCMC